MATLNPGNIVNGNTIQTSDLLQLYKAFGTGSGDSITGLAMTGSLNGNASTATTSSHALSASKITTITTGSGAVYYPVVVNSGGSTNTPIVVSTFELSASILNNITASRAITASYALNAASSPNTVNVTPQGLSSRAMYPIAGYAQFNGIIPTSASVSIGTAYPSLPLPTALGTNIWVTANSTDDPGPNIKVVYNPGINTIEFYTDTATDPLSDYAGFVVFTGYIQQ